MPASTIALDIIYKTQKAGEKQMEKLVASGHKTNMVLNFLASPPTLFNPSKCWRISNLEMPIDTDQKRLNKSIYLQPKGQEIRNLARQKTFRKTTAPLQPNTKTKLLQPPKPPAAKWGT